MRRLVAFLPFFGMDGAWAVLRHYAPATLPGVCLASGVITRADPGDHAPDVGITMPILVITTDRAE